MTIVNVNLRGELEKFIESYIQAGYASTRAEVIRIGLNKLREEEKNISDEQLHQATINAHWNNPSDEKASEFYIKRYLK